MDDWTLERVFSGQRLDAASQVAFSRDVSTRFMRAVRLLIEVQEIGSPGASETVKIEPVFRDGVGKGYFDANTTYGTVTLTGSDTPVSKSYVIPFPGVATALKLTGSSTLTGSTGFIVDAWFALLPYGVSW